MLTRSPTAVIIIPVTILWNVRIDVRKKLAFIGLFSLTLITIAAAMTRAIETNVTKKANGLHDTSYVWTWGTIQASLGRLRMTPRRFRSLIPRHSYHCYVSLGIPSTFRSIYPQGQAQVDPDGYLLPASKVTSTKAAGEVDGPALRHLGTLVLRLRSKDYDLRPSVCVRKSTAGNGAGDGPIQCLIRGSHVSKRNSAKPNHAAGRIQGRRRLPARG